MMALGHLAVCIVIVGFLVAIIFCSSKAGLWIGISMVIGGLVMGLCVRIIYDRELEARTFIGTAVEVRTEWRDTNKCIQLFRLKGFSDILFIPETFEVKCDGNSG